jgi:hypothetical protein
MVGLSELSQLSPVEPPCCCQESQREWFLTAFVCFGGPLLSQDAGAAQVVLVRLVHGAHVVAAPGLGLWKMVPDKLAGALGGQP